VYGKYHRVESNEPSVLSDKLQVSFVLAANILLDFTFTSTRWRWRALPATTHFYCNLIDMRSLSSEPETHLGVPCRAGHGAGRSLLAHVPRSTYGGCPLQAQHLACTMENTTNALQLPAKHRAEHGDRSTNISHYVLLSRRNALQAFQHIQPPPLVESW
jgi:hypothetical protein